MTNVEAAALVHTARRHQCLIADKKAAAAGHHHCPYLTSSASKACSRH
jgi:hypothetical protein